jgi:hypothetical protein
MGYMFFWSLFFVLSTAVCQFSYLYGGIDRTFRGLNKGAAESSIDITKKDRRGWPMFNTKVFVGNAKAFFAYNLSAYLKPSDYSLKYSFFNEDGSIFILEPTFCSALKVTIEADIMSLTHYSNSVYFIMQKGSIYD